MREINLNTSSLSFGRQVTQAKENLNKSLETLAKPIEKAASTALKKVGTTSQNIISATRSRIPKALEEAKLPSVLAKGSQGVKKEVTLKKNNSTQSTKSQNAPKSEGQIETRPKQSRLDRIKRTISLPSPKLKSEIGTTQGIKKAMTDGSLRNRSRPLEKKNITLLKSTDKSKLNRPTKKERYQQALSNDKNSTSQAEKLAKLTTDDKANQDILNKLLDRRLAIEAGDSNYSDLAEQRVQNDKNKAENTVQKTLSENANSEGLNAIAKRRERLVKEQREEAYQKLTEFVENYPGGAEALKQTAQSTNIIAQGGNKKVHDVKLMANIPGKGEVYLSLYKNDPSAVAAFMKEVEISQELGPDLCVVLVGVKNEDGTITSAFAEKITPYDSILLNDTLTTHKDDILTLHSELETLYQKMDSAISGGAISSKQREEFIAKLDTLAQLNLPNIGNLDVGGTLNTVRKHISQTSSGPNKRGLNTLKFFLQGSFSKDGTQIHKGLANYIPKLATLSSPLQTLDQKLEYLANNTDKLVEVRKRGFALIDHKTQNTTDEGKLYDLGEAMNLNKLKASIENNESIDPQKWGFTTTPGYKHPTATREAANVIQQMAQATSKEAKLALFETLQNLLTLHDNYTQAGVYYETFTGRPINNSNMETGIPETHIDDDALKKGNCPSNLIKLIHTIADSSTAKPADLEEVSTQLKRIRADCRASSPPRPQL